ncbi:DNA invertase [Halioglobus sp. HI00S01]|uniref:recombinase family protein n=1 Tax=Halioglobus sp. HI00S01 TaxID=1822214 RepID=UPI0007C29320|nr:recombinase family protein [Halioglobus sp. HI00S01]KZX59188.1 DNA invertase [Halioglobus sp. HI00S01]
MSEAVIGYARTSTLEQVAGFEAQITALQAAGATKMFQEQVSSVAERAQLNAALDYVRDGDTLVVTKLDRLARNTRHLGEIVHILEAKGVSLNVLDINLDTSTTMGKFMLSVMGAVAELERDMMLERQKEGIAKAQAEGRYNGRPKTYDADRVKALKDGGASIKEIQEELGISRASIYRLLKE